MAGVRLGFQNLLDVLSFCAVQKVPLLAMDSSKQLKAAFLRVGPRLPSLKSRLT